MSNSTKEHWNRVYKSNSVEQLGWYEDRPTESLEMIANCSIERHDPILDVGAGATTLIDHLVRQGYENIIALDISAVALEKLRTRLGTQNASRVRMLVDDIIRPDAVLGLKDITIWHDRALLHFLTEERQRAAYLSVLKKVLKVGGHVVIAAFAMDGATKCSGLDVKRYDDKSLAAFLGEEFALKESLDYRYMMPSGAIRPYVYTRFQREA